MITSSYNVTATERILPKLALDFTTPILDSRITFSRSLATATRVNSLGFVAGIAADTPRFDYDPITLACKGLLIEEARTNVLLQSQEIHNLTVWPSTRATVSLSSTTSPDGTANASLFNEETVENSTHIVQQSLVSLNTSTAYTYSIFAKNINANYIVISVRGQSGNYASVLFNIATGTVVSSAVLGTGFSIISTDIVPKGNDWYRCSLSFTSGISVTSPLVFFSSWDGVTPYSLSVGSGTPIYTGTSRTMYVWGAQLEAGAFATSYIPTTSAALTRNADVATMTGTNFSDWFNASEGTFAQVSYPIGPFGIVSMAGVGDNFNSRIALANGASGIFTVYDDAGNPQASIGGTTNYAGTVFKSAGAYKANSFAVSVNGETPATDSAGAVPSNSNALNIGSRNSSAPNQFLNGYVRSIRYWPQRLTNAELQAFSK